MLFSFSEGRWVLLRVIEVRIWLVFKLMRRYLMGRLNLFWGWVNRWSFWLIRLWLLWLLYLTLRIYFILFANLRLLLFIPFPHVHKLIFLLFLNLLIDFVRYTNFHFHSLVLLEVPFILFSIYCAGIWEGYFLWLSSQRFTHLHTRISSDRNKLWIPV